MRLSYVKATVRAHLVYDMLA